MKNNLKLKPFSALIFKGFLCVLAGVLRPSYTRFDEKCNSQKSFEQEKKISFQDLYFSMQENLIQSKASDIQPITTRGAEYYELLKSNYELLSAY